MNPLAFQSAERKKAQQKLVSNEQSVDVLQSATYHQRKLT